MAGVFGLPFGLAMVLICGAELFTGNTCSMAVALYEGNINFGDLIKNWVLSYAGACRASSSNSRYMLAHDCRSNDGRTT